MSNPTVIKIRRGLNGHRYAAFNSKGQFICNFDKLSDARKHWDIEIKLGLVVLIRELDRKAVGLA